MDGEDREVSQSPVNQEETAGGNKKQGLDEEGSPADDDSKSIESDKGDEGYLTDGGFEDDEQPIEQKDPAKNPSNGLPFYKFLVYRLEKLWKRKREKQAYKRWKEKEKLEYILPRQMLLSLNGHSVYPYLRLLLPEQDSRRQFRVKERKIVEAYCKALGFGKGTKNYEMLMVRNDGKWCTCLVHRDGDSDIVVSLFRTLPILRRYHQTSQGTYRL